MTAQVVLNPFSGRGRAARLRGRLEAALEEAGLPYQLTETRAPLDGLRVAAEAARQGRSPVLAAGGDGLISEVINGLYRHNPDGELGPLGLIPMGTANDLATNLGLPLTIEAAVEAVAVGSTRRLDLGQVGDWVFHNNSAVGLEPVVSLHNTQLKALRGVLRYLVAALRAIVDGRCWNMALRWDGGRLEGPTTLTSVGNNPLTGGLFRMAPAADPTDGRLTFVHAYASNRRKMLALLPRTLSGTHVDDPGVQQHHCTRLEIESDPPTPLQVDGELRGTDHRMISYRILPARLRLLAPPAADPDG